MLLSKRAMSKGQAVLFLKSSRLGIALVEENHPSPWPWRDLGYVDDRRVFDQHCPCFCLTHLYLELLSLPYSRTSNNHFRLSITLFHISLFLSTIEWDSCPCLDLPNLCQRQGHLPFHFLFCLKTSLLFLPTSLLHTVREMTAFPLVWLGLSPCWGTQQGDNPRQYSRSVTALVWMQQRYDLTYPPSSLSSGHQHDVFSCSIWVTTLTMLWT